MPAGDPVLTYRCYDVQTCTPQSNLPFYAVSFGQTVSSDDTFTGTLKLSDEVFERLNWERATRPNWAMIVVDNDSPSGFAPWGGMVTGRKYNAKDQTLVVTATTLGVYAKMRLQAQDYTKPDPSAPYWAANPADPTAIAAQVIYDMLTESHTMVSLIAQYCNLCTGVQLYVNGNPPPSVTGCTPYSIVQSGNHTVYCFGRNGCATIGSDISDTGGAITPGTLSAVTVHSNHPAIANDATLASYTTGSHVLHGVTSAYPLAVGMLADCPDFSIGTTVDSLDPPSFSAGRYHYATVTLSTGCSAGHSAVNGTIGGYFTVVMSNAGLSLARETVDIANGNPTSLNPIEGSYPITQLQTVDAIFQGLAKMGYGTGFDYSWDVAFMEGTKTPVVNLNIETPRKGRVWPGSGIVIDLEQASEWDYTENGLNQAIGLVESAQGSGGVLTTKITDSGLVTGDGYIPAEAAISHTQVNTKDQLQALAAGDWSTIVWPVATLTATIPLIINEPAPGEPNPPGIRLGALNTGDDHLVVLNFGNDTEAGLPPDPRFPAGLSFVFELQSWKATIPEVGEPTVLLTYGLPPVDSDCGVVPATPPCTTPIRPPVGG